MAFSEEHSTRTGASLLSKVAPNDEGVINDGKGNYYQINNFQRGQSEGLDEDKGAAFGSSLHKDAQAEGFDVTSFNTT